MRRLLSGWRGAVIRGPVVGANGSTKAGDAREAAETL